MQKRELVGAVVACLTAISMLALPNRRQVSVFIGSSTSNSQQPAAFAYYKLSLHWPPAVCTGSDRIIECRRPFLGDFKIHGFWPTRYDDTPVPPYDPQNPCTNIQPVPPEQLMQHLSSGTQQRLSSYWPMLSDYTYPPANEAFWKQEWGRHGMCSDWPNRPDDYFQAGLQQGQPFSVSLRQRLQRLGPSAQTDYEVGQIWNFIHGLLNINPEIACNEDDHGVRQLFEIRLCYEWNYQQQPPQLVLRNCPRPFSKSCSRPTDRVWFRPA